MVVTYNEGYDAYNYSMCLATFVYRCLIVFHVPTLL